tara:strand:+ start:165 stop:494 length:330 start_codon:yes stop_codon:yes gene_type:complete
MSTKITVVFHPDCQPSMRLLSVISSVPNIDIDYINYKEDEFDSQINIDILPLIIVGRGNEIYKGKGAFDKIEELNTPVKDKKRKSMYEKKVVFVEDKDKKKERIDLDKR